MDTVDVLPGAFATYTYLQGGTNAAVQVMVSPGRLILGVIWGWMGLPNLSERSGEKMSKDEKSQMSSLPERVVTKAIRSIVPSKAGKGSTVG